MEHFGDTLRREDRSPTSDPAPFPLLPDDGESFLNGSIQPQVYLADRRAQEYRKAVIEVDEMRTLDRSLRMSIIAAVVMTIISLTNVVVVLSALFKNYFEIAIVGLMIVVFGTTLAVRQILNIQRRL